MNSLFYYVCLLHSVPLGPPQDRLLLHSRVHHRATPQADHLRVSLPQGRFLSLCFQLAGFARRHRLTYIFGWVSDRLILCIFFYSVGGRRTDKSPEDTRLLPPVVLVSITKGDTMLFTLSNSGATESNNIVM